jgi:hypothetical protein
VAKRRKNPRSRYGAPTTGEQRRLIRNSHYRDRVEKLRPYFGDLFKAKPDGSYDLRKSPDQWSSQAKAKLTKYWRVIAPQIAQKHKARFFRRPDHLKAAIVHTQQEDFLPGQRAALFPLEAKEKLTIKFTRRGRIRVDRQGVGVEKSYFDPQLMFKDPEAAANDALDRLPDGALRYKIMMGPHESRGTWDRAGIVPAVLWFVSKYESEEQFDPYDTHSRFYTNWMFGLVGYYARAGSKLDRILRQRRAVRDAEIEARREMYDEYRKEARATIRKKKKQRKKRAKK